MSFFDLTLAALHQQMAPLHVSHVRTLWRAIYREGERQPADRRDFLPPLQKWLRTLDPLFFPEAVHTIPSHDGLTHKTLLQLADSAQIETVLMGYPGRHTACLSTQVGCAMGCVFCATGQGGFTRHLAAGEIVSQVLHHQAILRQNGQGHLRNLVLMGMGEPLHNYAAVMAALDIISDTRGINIGPRRISISTVGVVPGIRRMAEENSPYNLAVSLHGATQAERARLVPVAKKWPLEELIDTCHFYCKKTARKIFFEWTLIENENDTSEQARALSDLLAGMPAHINLIPLNPTAGYNGAPSLRAVKFKTILRAAGFPVTIRQRRGIDVAAGCGQLAANCGQLAAS